VPELIWQWRRSEQFGNFGTEFGPDSVYLISALNTFGGGGLWRRFRGSYRQPWLETVA